MDLPSRAGSLAASRTAAAATTSGRSAHAAEAAAGFVTTAARPSQGLDASAMNTMDALGLEEVRRAVPLDLSHFLARSR